MAVITISRQFGAGGLTMGKLLAERIGYTFFSDEIIKMVAKEARVSSNWVKMVEKEAGGKLQRFVSGLVPRGLMDRVLDDQSGYIDEEIYVDLLKQIISQIAKEDNCIILGRGGQYILKDHPNVFHLLLIADQTHRIDFMKKKYGLTQSQATQAITVEGKKRISLYKKFHKTDYDRPEHYHMTLNMGLISMEKAVDAVCCILAQKCALPT